MNISLGNIEFSRKDLKGHKLGTHTVFLVVKYSLFGISVMVLLAALAGYIPNKAFSASMIVLMFFLMTESFIGKFIEVVYKNGSTATLKYISSDVADAVDQYLSHVENGDTPQAVEDFPEYFHFRIAPYPLFFAALKVPALSNVFFKTYFLVMVVILGAMLAAYIGIGLFSGLTMSIGGFYAFIDYNVGFSFFGIIVIIIYILIILEFVNHRYTYVTLVYGTDKLFTKSIAYKKEKNIQASDFYL